MTGVDHHDEPVPRNDDAVQGAGDAGGLHETDLAVARADPVEDLRGVAHLEVDLDLGPLSSELTEPEGDEVLGDRHAGADRQV